MPSRWSWRSGAISTSPLRPTNGAAPAQSVPVSAVPPAKVEYLFEPDKAVPLGGPFKVYLLGDGAEPRVQLAFTPPGDEQKVTLVLVNRQQGGAISFEYNLAIRVDKSKDEKQDATKDDFIAASANIENLDPGADGYPYIDAVELVGVNPE